MAVILNRKDWGRQKVQTKSREGARPYAVSPTTPGDLLQEIDSACIPYPSLHRASWSYESFKTSLVCLTSTSVIVDMASSAAQSFLAVSLLFLASE
jgi:hypothetical protein